MEITYPFTPGTRAVAQQVNQNFADVKSAVDPLETDVAAIQAQLTSGIILPDGSVDFTRLQSYKTYTVSNATNATPIVVTAVAHDFLTGDKVYISGVGGNTAANGVFTITKIGVDTFSLDGSTGNGAFSSNGTAVIYPMSSDNLVNKVYVDTEISLNNEPTASTANMPTLANNITDANNDIDFSLGFCYDLTTNIKITNTALIKRLDATFVAGTNQGGLDTGTKAISTWYACFAISKADGTADFLFSLSPTAPTMPSGFVNKRRIGWIRTETSGNIKSFTFHKDTNKFIYGFYVDDLNTTSHTAGYTDLVVTCPPNKIPLLVIQIYMIATGDQNFLIKDKNNGQFDVVSASLASLYTPKNSEVIKTDSQSKIQYNSAGASNAQYYIRTYGFYDGRLD